MDDAFYKTLIRSIPDAVYVHDRHGRIREANEAACRQTGYSHAQLCELSVQELNPFRNPEEIHALLRKLEEGGAPNQVFRGRHLCADGRVLPVEVNLTLIPAEPDPLFLAVVRDRTPQVKLERDLEDKVSFDQLLLHISLRLVNIEPDEIDLVINQVLADIGHHFQAGRSYVFTIDHEAGTFSNTHEWNDEGVAPEIDNLQDLPFDAFPWLMERILDQREAHIPDVNALPDEVAHEREEYIRQRIRSLIIVPIIRGGEVTGLFGLDTIREKRYWNEDIRDNLRLLGQMLANAMDAVGLGRQLQHLAYHDSLTQLPNRQLLRDRIDQAANQCRRDGGRLSVMLLDLDDFKLINDTLSHSAGDELLCSVAARLKEISRESDTVARLGGDEFVLVARVRDADDAASLAKRALDSVSRPMDIQAHSIVTHPSIGISLFPDDETSHESLLGNADLAMYAAKAAGKNRFAFFDESMTERARNMLHMRHELTRGLKEGQLLLHFQPRIDLSNASVCGIEALVRWHHPERGLLSPAEFLPIAERSELICLIDHWVLEESKRAMDLLQLGQKQIRIAVNLSARDLYDAEHADRLLAKIREYYGQGGIPLEIEITESTLMQDINAAILQLERIKSVVPDVHIAIDDFGSGYSSLNYLRRLPIDTLKIDQAFIRDIKEGNDSAEAIIRSVIDLARNLGLRVVAEGIEHESQAQLLTRLGCDEAQGYFFARPLALDKLARLLGRDLKLQATPPDHQAI